MKFGSVSFTAVFSSLSQNQDDTNPNPDPQPDPMPNDIPPPDVEPLPTPPAEDDDKEDIESWVKTIGIIGRANDLAEQVSKALGRLAKTAGEGAIAGAEETAQLVGMAKVAGNAAKYFKTVGTIGGGYRDS